MRTRQLLIPSLVASALLSTLSCSAFAADNLLSNGDAEAAAVGEAPPHWLKHGYDGKEGYPTDFELLTVAGGRSGSRAISFVCPPQGYVWNYVQQHVAIDVDPSKRAVFSAWLRADEPMDGVGFHLYLTPRGDKEGGSSARSVVAVTTDWQKFDISLEFGLLSASDPRGYNLRPIVQINSRGKRLYVDDAELILADTRITPQVRAALNVAKAILPADVRVVSAPIGITGGIVARPDGSLLAFTSDFGLRRSADGGLTWSDREPIAVDDPLNMITGVVQMRDGTIGIHTESWNQPAYFWKSSDGGKTWSKRIQMGPKGAPLHGNVMIETRDGRLVIPMREGHSVHGGLWEGAGAFGTVDGKRVLTEGHAHAMEMDISFVYFSTDKGNSWSRSQGDIIIWKDDGLGGMWPCDEPNVAELSDGRLIMFLRTTLGRLYQTFSSDGARRWDYPTATDLPSSYSPCSLERIPENDHTVAAGRAGHLVCVWNNVSNDEIKRGFRRGRLSVAVSTDDGHTWTHAKTVDAAGLPPISGIAPLSEPAMVRAEKDLGELPMPFGAVDYPDIAFAGDKVLIKYGKNFKKPEVGLGGQLVIAPIDWLYRD
ncbi:MAG: sialidase family protein [Planctomycetota bacterium]